MILEVHLLSDSMEPMKKIRYYSYHLEHQSVKDMIQYSQNIPSMTCDEPLQSVVLFSWKTNEGTLLKVSVARSDLAFVVVVADMLESDVTMVEKATSIAFGLEELGETVKNARTSSRASSMLVSFINEQVLDHVRFALFGPARVGKTSIFSLLTNGVVLSRYRSTSQPTVAPNIGLYSDLIHHRDFSLSDEWFMIANRILTIYDLPGKPALRRLWTSYLRRVDVGVLVVRSTKRSVKLGRMILEKFKHKLPKLVIAIANFQDLPSALTPDVIQNYLGVNVYGMVATDQDRVEHIRDLFKTVAITRLQMMPIPSAL